MRKAVGVSKISAAGRPMIAILTKSAMSVKPSVFAVAEGFRSLRSRGTTRHSAIHPPHGTGYPEEEWRPSSRRDRFEQANGSGH
jgi:hypothetical protein